MNNRNVIFSILFVGTSVFCLSGNTSTTESSCPCFRQSNISLRDFFRKHPYVARAAIVWFNALETIAIDKNINFLGIAQANKSFTPSRYITHNLANAFPTVASLFNISIDQYTEKGPMVKATNLPALTALGGLLSQNYFLSQYLYGTDNPALESACLTLGGYLLAWASCLLFGVFHCNC